MVFIFHFAHFQSTSVVMTTHLLEKILKAIVARELTFPNRDEFYEYYKCLVDSLVLSFVAYASELCYADLHALATELTNGDAISPGRMREMLVDNAVANFQRYINATPLAELRFMTITLHTTYNKVPWSLPLHPTLGAIPIIPPRVLPRTYAGVVKGNAPVVRYDPRCCSNGDACVLGRRCDLVHF